MNFYLGLDMGTTGVKAAVFLLVETCILVWEMISYATMGKKKVKGARRVFGAKTVLTKGRKELYKNVKDVCAECARAHNGKGIGAGTRMQCAITSDMYGNSIGVQVQLTFTVYTDKAKGSNGVQREQEIIREYVQNFPTVEIQNRIFAALDVLSEEYPDIGTEFDVQVSVDHSVQTM